MSIFSFPGVTVNFSQPIFSASESDGLVRICVEVVSGHLGTDISLPLQLGTSRSLLMGNNYFNILHMTYRSS